MANIKSEELIEIARHAGKLILEIYHSDNFEAQLKEDQSPITKADRIANDYICNELQRVHADIPILSEENKHQTYSERKNWKNCFIVDPIDGTKEFIKKNDEFTVNIAYAINGKTIEGVVYAPALDLLYYTKEGKSFKTQGNQTEQLPIKQTLKNYTVVISRSHPNELTQNYIENLKLQFPNLEMKALGSSLKMCAVAEGSANLYPRLGPISEWDTAAAHAIVKNAGGNLWQIENKKEVIYNKENLLNPHFIAGLNKPN